MPGQLNPLPIVFTVELDETTPPTATISFTALLPRVCDEDVAAPVHRHAIGLVESAANRIHDRAGRDHPANRNDLLHRIVL